ncbi:MAG TPA: hypothetical protein PJ982_19690 [Lacipirellulaceae bacterium]|nr:hypothetical protein [Lacipirellulaceae bacterium]
MTKYALAAATLAAALLGTQPASAQYGGRYGAGCQPACGPSHGDEFKAAFHENRMWPSQYVQPSRRAICQSVDLMIANGWRRHNLLGQYDFDPDGDGLSESGRLRVQWILTQAPPHRRTIFVERMMDPATTAARVEAVHSVAASMGGMVGPVDVQETYLREESRPAANVDAMFTAFQEGQMNNYPPSLQAPGIHQGSGQQ